jgi:hypothetical protein
LQGSFDNRYVRRIGDTMTGNLLINGALTASSLNLPASAAISWNSGDVTLTHSAGKLALSDDTFDIGGKVILNYDGASSPDTTTTSNCYGDFCFISNFPQLALNARWDKTQNRWEYVSTNEAGWFAIDYGGGSTYIATAVSGTAGSPATKVINAQFYPSESVFNDGSADINFRVETNDDANALYCDGGTDMCGVGTGAPKTKLEVVGTISGSTVIGNTYQVGPIALFGPNAKIATGSGMEIQFSESGSIVRTIWDTETAGSSATVSVEDSSRKSIYSSNPTLTSRTVTESASITNAEVGPYRPVRPEILSVGASASSGATITFAVRRAK